MSELNDDSNEDGLIITPSRRLFLGTLAAGSTLGLSGCSLVDMLSGDFQAMWRDTVEAEKTRRLVEGRRQEKARAEAARKRALARQEVAKESQKRVASRSKSSRSKRSLSSGRHDARFLSFHNTHTGEKLKVTYWEKGHYLKDALSEVNHHLRDHRTNDVIKMDPRLLDQLFVIRQKMGFSQPFHVISGYRSPKTNAMLRRQGRGVARRSLHMSGRAIDIRVPGQNLSKVRLAALSMHSGGVGYYPSARFVHLDTGRVRRW
jgi:uncharacterized protein YcbK (DUF882 family)